MICKKCGQEVDKKAVICTGCGCKIKKPVYKKWWFWVLIALVVLIIGSASGGDETTTVSDESNVTNESVEIVYEAVDLKKMFDELEANAMKAEDAYQDKDIEFKCKIKSFDSDGGYISVEPTNASEWNFITATCNIKNDTQKEFLMEKSAGDVITIKGKVTSVGEVLGYSINISEVY